MPVVKTFNKNMIEEFLKNDWEVKYMIDSDGDYCVQFSRDEDSGKDYRVYFCCEGTNDDVYSIKIFVDDYIEKSDWGTAMMACNEWNGGHRCPTAHLRIDEEKDRAMIILDQSLNLEKGIHQELFNDFSRLVAIGGFRFWEWAHKEKGL